MGRDIETLYGPRSRKRRCIRNLATVSLLLVVPGILAWKYAFVAKLTAIPALTKQWHAQVYSLDEGETVRFIPPPYTPERMTNSQLYWEKQLGFVVNGKDRLSTIDRAYWYFMLHRPPGGLFIGNYHTPPRPVGNVQAAMEFGLKGLWPDVIVAEELKNVPADGDWIVRGGTPLDQRMMALQSVLRSVTGRDLLIAYEPVEHEVDDFDDWSLRLDNHKPLNVIKERRLDPGIVMRERKTKAQR